MIDTKADSESHTLVVVSVAFMRGFFRFPLANHFDLPGSVYNWYIPGSFHISAHMSWPRWILPKRPMSIYCHLASLPEKAMATHSSTLAWKIPWPEEPGRLQSMESLRVGRDWATSLSLFTFIHWRRKWQPTPVFLPGESQGWRSLVGCLLWGCTESDTTETI